MVRSRAMATLTAKLTERFNEKEEEEVLEVVMVGGNPKAAVVQTLSN